MQFSFDDFEDLRSAEPALTAAHAGIRSSFYAIDGLRRNWCMKRIDNLAFRDGFTSADDSAIERILLDFLFLFLQGEFLEVGRKLVIVEILLL